MVKVQESGLSLIQQAARLLPVRRNSCVHNVGGRCNGAPIYGSRGQLLAQDYGNAKFCVADEMATPCCPGAETTQQYKQRMGRP